jgi:hypothetical protein
MCRINFWRRKERKKERIIIIIIIIIRNGANTISLQTSFGDLTTHFLVAATKI